MDDNLEREKWRFHIAREKERDIPERENMVLLVLYLARVEERGRGGLDWWNCFFFFFYREIGRWRR